MPSIGLGELTILAVYLVVLGLIVGLPIRAIRQIRRNRDRLQELEGRVDELENGAGPDRS